MARIKEDDNIRMAQCQQLFRALIDLDAFLVITVVANPDDPHATFQYLKNHKGSDRDTIIILRSLAERIENGTMPLALNASPEGLDKFKI